MMNLKMVSQHSFGNVAATCVCCEEEELREVVLFLFIAVNGISDFGGFCLLSAKLGLRIEIPEFCTRRGRSTLRFP
jgi:hypothetical protein